MTCNVGTPGMVLTVWVVAGLLSLAGALTYAELAAMMPRAGGEYVFMREAYGPRRGLPERVDADSHRQDRLAGVGRAHLRRLAQRPDGQGASRAFAQLTACT